MIRQFFATWLLTLCITVSALAQQKLTIRITDQQMLPIHGATITIDGKSKQTNEKGLSDFLIGHEASRTMKVQHLGYRTLTAAIEKEKTHIEVSLQPLHLQTGEAFVYATRAKENSATTFKNINKEEIRKSNLGQDIPYLINQTPSVVVGSDAGAGIGYTNITIRGSDNERINVTLNGIPLNDAESMGSFFVNLPDFASSMESIQIQRGIGTSTNGAGAFGASLNIQTDALENNPYAEFNNSFGSYNSWKNTLKVGSGLINDKYAFNARLSRISSDGYMERATSDMKSFYVDGGLYTEKHTLKATLFSGKQKTYQAWTGVPEPLIKGDRSLLTDYAGTGLGIYDGPELDRILQADRRYNVYTYDNQTDNYTQTHAHLQYTNRINDKLDLNTALHYTRGAGYYEEYRLGDKLAKYNMEDVTLGGEKIKKSDLIRRRWLDNHFYGLTYALNYKPTSAVNMTLGGAYNQYKGDHYGQVIWARYASNSELGDKYYLNDAQKNDFNIFAKADYRIDKWLLNLDVQYRNIYYQVQGNDDKVKDMDFDNNLNFVNPKAGITYFLSSHANLYASYAYANKEPVRKDYVENPRNEFPKAEKMQDIEAGYRFTNNTFNLGANVYAMLYKDQLIPTGSINDTGGALRMNIPKSHRIGLELDGTWKISKQFSWAATLALSDNKIKNFIEYVPVYDDDWVKIREEVIEHGNTNILKSASTILSNNVTYSPVEALSFSLLSKYVSRLYLDNTSNKNRSIDPSFVNNLVAQYSFQALGLQRVDLSLAVNNILNTKYESHGYTWRQMFESKGSIEHYNFYYPQATTNFMLGLNIRF
ncbi:TonB-dependent receptor [Sphingobacterium faecale]|uniref:TonB-dependent receptor n=1 Tax=Sphingobacterium faecale TaxID=2803775 RepID=A0ABS1R880_9SPHI|nr:TonB-dependent receptor [Sphingobacterium faecale]MBL1410730.1 TonB-dependent receptor [Sphingobacterium faecale]